MITTSMCQRCSQLPPPPPIFSLGPPPNILSLDIHCSSRLFSSSSSSIQHKKVISSSTSVPIALGILIALLISTGTILFIKNRMIKRRQRKYNDRSLSVKFTGQQNRTIDSSHYYCLIYCRQCGNYHQTSRSSCACHLRNDNHFFELQPMFQDLNHH